MDDQNKKLKEFINKGSEIAGAATSGVLGFLAAGPAGAAIGAVSGPIITMSIKALSDHAQRVLSNREAIRIAGVSALTIERIRIRINNGEEPRNDYFFEESTKSQSKASEIFEGVLLKSRSEHEERKLPLYANLFESICFRSDITSDQANWIVQLLDNFTYRHIEILYAFFEIGDESKWLWNMIYGLSDKEPFIASCISELKNYHLLAPDHWGDSPVKITNFGIKLIEIIQFSKVVDHTFDDVTQIIIQNPT